MDEEKTGSIRKRAFTFLYVLHEMYKMCKLWDAEGYLQDKQLSIKPKKLDFLTLKHPKRRQTKDRQNPPKCFTEKQTFEKLEMGIKNTQ